jgi:beta-glucosidase
MRPFPAGFLWGTATSAYQIEGAAGEDGRGPSIWDTFAHEPGRIENGDTGDVACDHYHRFREDVDLMAGLGLNAYRFSVSWPRVLPGGDGAVNARGLDFYDALVDALLEHGIAPVVTLYHWDLPQALQERGGWAARATADAFAGYAATVAERLGDRVRLWITHNEPWISAFVGHAHGRLAPGIADWKVATQAAHHMLLSHGRAVLALRAAGVAEVGIAPNLTPVAPGSDRAAATLADEFVCGWFLDPIFRGAYPERAWSRLVERGLEPRVEDGDLAEIAAPIDFLGVNYYFGARVVADDGPFGYRELPPDPPVTACGWPIVPDLLRSLLARLAERYEPPAIYVTENGAAFDDPPPVDGLVRDPERVTFLRDHFAAALDAIAAGVPLRGYFVWSLLDNFEWSHGYSRRFGVVHVDHGTQARTIKESARFLARVARANALPERGLIAPRHGG